VRRRAAGALIACYLADAGLSLVAPGLVGRRIAGQFTVGLAVGFAEMAAGVAIAVLYTAEMAKHVDPLADAVRSTGRGDAESGDAEPGDAVPEGLPHAAARAEEAWR
jgi:uncharacterized membrane protein (DUF485 family)